MAHEAARETDTSVTGLVRGVMDDARDLLREELALARAEARVELSKAAAAGARFGASAVAAWFALLFVLLALATGVSDLLGWPPAAGFGIVGLLLGAAALGATMSARAAARRVRGLPRTVAAVKENFR